MITRLALTNFRRHIDTELRFGPDDRLITITGANGVGKTTLLEALLFAFFGETRNGRRALDSLCARGHEPEGVRVECEFTVAGTSYRVERRRVERISTAALWSDGVAVAEGAQAVDREMQNILGMDATGFKLAVIAKQKELDGLTSLSRQERRTVLARLLRVDVVAKAAEAAHVRFVRASDVLAAMGPEPDIEAAKAAVEEAHKDAAAHRSALGGAESKVAELQQLYADGESVRVSMREALDRVARAEGACTAAESDLADVRRMLDAVVVPAAPAPIEVTPADVLDRLRGIELERQHAQAAADAAANHRALIELHTEVTETLRQVEQELGELDEAAETLPGKAAALNAASELHASLQRRRNDLAEVRAAAKARQRSGEVRVEALQQIGADCGVCGQPVSDEHRLSELEQVSRDVVDAAAEVVAADEEGQVLAAELVRVNGELRALQGQLDALHVKLAGRDSLVGRAAELTRRRDSYELRLVRDVPEAPDLGELAARERELLEQLEHAKALTQTWSEYEQARSRRDDLESRVARAADLVALRAGQVEEVRPDKSLVDAFTALEQVADDLEVERSVVGFLRTEQAKVDAVAQMAEQRLRDAESFARKRAGFAQEARVAAHTKALLRDVHDRLATELRPNLEVAVSDLLARISDGRFPQVRLSEDYEISVLDGGAWRGLQDLSGGEADLVALATRLALSQVVAERSGSDALGLLILDEVFGSQDASRRESILTALRELRSTFGQVFLISHVGGVEEAADRVVDIQASADRSETEVTVL